MTDRFSGYTPDGKHTTSVRRYLRSWTALTTPFCKATGLKRSSFDPTVVFFDPKTGASVQLPVWFIKMVLANRIQP